MQYVFLLLWKITLDINNKNIIFLQHTNSYVQLLRHGSECEVHTNQPCHFNQRDVPNEDIIYIGF